MAWRIGLPQGRVHEWFRTANQQIRRRRKGLHFQSLEDRRLLVTASDLAAIVGTVSSDGALVSGANIELYRDNGDGNFNSASDTRVTNVTTGSDGRYQFPRLQVGNYFVFQPAQSIGGRTLTQTVSPLVVISATDVQGTVITTIDGFQTAEQTVIDTTNDNVPVTSSVAAAQVIGGERDLFVNKTSDAGEISISVNNSQLPGLLSFDSARLGNGVRRIIWDGVDGNALIINDAGLNGTDLTSGGTAAGLRLQLGADRAGGNAIIRLYTNDSVAGTANRFSTATLVIPDTGGQPSAPEFVPFSQFVATSGGGANLSSIDAIELEISGTANVNGTVDLVGSLGSTTFTQNLTSVGNADLSLTKTVDLATPSVGSNVTYVVTVNNAGPVAASGVAIRDTLPSGVTFVSATASQGSFNSSTGIWTVGNVPVGGVAPLISIIGRVNATGSRVNTAEITASDQRDPDSTPGNGVATEDDIASVTFDIPVADLSLTKTTTNERPNQGSEFAYNVALSNDGPSPATGVTVRDQIPTGVTFISSTVTSGTYNATTGVWDLGTVAAGATSSLTINVRMNSSAAVSNTAQVATSNTLDPDSTPGNSIATEDDQQTVTVTPRRVDLSVTKVVDRARPAPGQNVTFTVGLSNAGPDAASGVIVTDQLPAGLTFVSSTATVGGYDSTTGRWNVGDVPVGSTPSLSIVAQFTGNGSLTNIAQVTAANETDVDSTPGNSVATEDDQASARVSPATADLSLTKTVSSATPNLGDNVVFTVRVGNLGPDAASGVRVRDLLPPEVTFVNAVPSVGTYESNTGVWEVGDLAVGANPSLVLTTTARSTVLVTNTGEIIASDQFDPDSTPGNNVPSEDDQASVNTQAQQVDLAVSKTISNARPNVNDEVTFVVTVTNAGPSRATGVVVTDRLPTDVSLVRSTPSQGSYNTTSGAWSVGAIELNRSATLTLVGRIQSIGARTNTAEVTAADQSDADSTPGNGIAMEDDIAAVDFQVPVADLSITKTVDNNRPNVGEEVTFRVTLSNAGPNIADGVRVTDILPPGVAFVSTSLSSGTYDAATGIWNIGTVPVSNNETLDILARIETVGAKTNVARVTTANQSDPDSTPGNNVSTEDDQAQVVITPTQVDLSLTKTASVARPTLGQTVDFVVTVRNTGQNNATGVQVTDLLPSGLAFVSSNVSVGSYDSGTGIWDVGDVVVEQSQTLTLTATVQSPGAKTNVAEITRADQFDIDSTPGNDAVGEDDIANAVVTPASADLSLTKTVNNGAPNIGTEVTYTLTVRNAGPDAASSIVVTDVIPTGLTFIRSTPSVGTYVPETGMWSIPTLANGGTATLAVVSRVETFGDKSNTAEITSSSQFDSDSTPGNFAPNEDDLATATLSPQLIDLALNKIVDEMTPNVGETIEYTLTLTNAGPSSATGVIVSDRLPTGLTFVSATPSQGTFDAASGAWTVGSVNRGATPTLKIRADVRNVRSLTNTAEVIAADQTDVDSTVNNKLETEDDFASVTFTTQLADLAVNKSVDIATPDRGDNVRFTVTLSNSGPNNATGIVVADALAAGLTFVSSNPSVGTYNPTSGRWTIDSLTTGGVATLDIIATVTRVLLDGTITNRAEVVNSDQFDPDSTPGNNVATEDDTAVVILTPNIIDLSIAASVDNDAPLEGDTIEITITTSNAGPTAASGVAASVKIPEGLTLLTSAPEQGTFDPTTGIWTIGALPAGEQTQLILTATVDVRGIKLLPIAINAADQFDIDSTPNNNVPAEDDQVELIIRAPRILTKRLFLSR
jgi:uncharacterized repeat protein (TIGR01451 family)